MTSRRQFHAPTRARGAVLFVALVFLVLLTLLALTATGTSILQERMTGGMRNHQLGLMGAETGARGGETGLWLLSYSSAQPLTLCASGAGGSCVQRPQPNGILPPAVQTFRTQKDWITGTGDGSFPFPQALTGLTGASETASLSAQPRYMVENLGPVRPPGGGQQKGTRDPEGRSAAGNHELYRITSRSQGGTAGVIRAVETVYSALDLINTGFNPDASP